MRDDRILPATRIVGALIPPFLVAAFVILYLLPNDTATLFAWTIKPAMTPMMMGAGYIAGAWFFVRLVLGRRWSLFALGFLPITTFTWFMLAATVLHWDRFNHEHVSFLAWLALYVITPFLVPALWLRNRRTDPGTLAPGDVRVPPPVRAAALLVGVVLTGAAVLLLVAPEAVIPVWPWTLTPLTARVVGGWLALQGVLGLMSTTDTRWGSWRIVLQSQAIGVALTLVGVARAWDELDRSRPMTWAFVAGLSALLAALVGLHVAMDARRGAETRPAAA